MARSASATINGRTLALARERSGYRVETVAKKLNVEVGKVLSWESGDAKPTLVQLRGVARLLGVTTAVLLARSDREFPAAPELPDFRRNHDGVIDTDLITEIRKARDRRARLLELAGPTGSLPAVELGRENIEETAGFVRELTGITVDDQRRFKDPRAALNGWISAVEGFGVLVSQVSGISTRDFLGMSIYFDEQSLILLNGADEPQRRIFTLFHELGHILTHTSGICDVYSQSRTEAVCNSFAAAFLLPREPLLAALGDTDPVAALDRLSTRFRVSQSAVAVRLHACKRLTTQQMLAQLSIARAIADEKRDNTSASGFAPPHVLKLRNLGETYVTAVLEAMHSGSISPVDASYFLEAKLPTVDKMEAEIERRAVGR